MESEVDVIIPTYNRGTYIERSLKSVLNQTYKSLMVYVIDDNSSDNTREIIEKIDDQRIVYYKNSENHGANYCRNLGIQLSSSKYIAFNDSDDVWRPNKIERQMEIIKNYNSLVFSPYQLIDVNKKNSIIGICSEEDLKDLHYRLLNGNVIGTPTILMNRDFFEKIGGFDVDMPRFQDWEFCLRASEKEEIGYCREILVDAYRINESITKDKVSAFKALQILTDRYSKDIINENLTSKWIEIYLSCELTLEQVRMLVGMYDVSDSMKSKYIEQTLFDLNKRIITQRDKINNYLEITSQLLQQSKQIRTWLKQNHMDSVCIYGNSITGNALGRFLQEEGIHICCYIDVDKYKSCPIKVISPNEYDENIYSNVIINTVPSIDEEISSMFESSQVITLKSIFNIMI